MRQLRTLHLRAALASAGLSLASCAAPQPAVRSFWLPAYAFGTVGGGELDVRDACASGRATELSVGSSFGTLVVGVATLGVYTPREATVRCAPAR
jgi:hypothetical protein